MFSIIQNHQYWNSRPNILNNFNFTQCFADLKQKSDVHLDRDITDFGVSSKLINWIIDFKIVEIVLLL